MDDFNMRLYSITNENQKNEPLGILKMRLAKWEITLDEFNKIKEHLE